MHIFNKILINLQFLHRIIDLIEIFFYFQSVLILMLQKHDKLFILFACLVLFYLFVPAYSTFRKILYLELI